MRTFDVYGRHWVDDSPDLDQRSLERHGRTVSWIRGGRRHSTRLETTGRCRIPPGAHIKAHDLRLLVYGVRKDPPNEDSVDLVACSRRTGKRFVMTHDVRYPEAFEASANFRVVGRFVAWSTDYRDRSGYHAVLIRVYDVHRREFLRSEQVHEHAPENEEDHGHDEDFAIRDIGVSRGGDVAWTLVLDDSASVEAWDSCGRRVLDRGSAIDPESLHVKGRTVTWNVTSTANGGDRSAELRSGADC